LTEELQDLKDLMVICLFQLIRDYIILMKKPVYLKNIPGIITACWEIINAGNSLLAATSQGVFLIENFKSNRLTQGFSLSLVSSRFSPLKVYIGQTDGLVSIEFKNGKWSDAQKIRNINNEVRELTEDSKGNLWFSNPSEGIFMYSPKRGLLKQFNESNGLPADFRKSSEYLLKG